jgi:hypothetical protein
VRDVLARYAEDDGALRHTFGLAWLALRHPLRVGTETLRRPGGIRSVLAVAPTARRLGQTLEAGAKWQSDGLRAADAELLRRVLGASAPITSGVEPAE